MIFAGDLAISCRVFPRCLHFYHRILHITFTSNHSKFVCILHPSKCSYLNSTHDLSEVRYIRIYNHHVFTSKTQNCRNMFLRVYEINLCCLLIFVHMQCQRGCIKKESDIWEFPGQRYTHFIKYYLLRQTKVCKLMELFFKWVDNFYLKQTLFMS